ncbi:MAG: DUF3094 family protein [Pseudomonadota bacterium]
MRKPELSDEDKQRVKECLDNNPLHSTERKPFRLWRLLLVLVAIVSLMSVFSLLVAKYYFYQ